MSTFPRHQFQRFHGFSLVEIMVALAIGMVAMIVVLQVFSASEANKRTTTGADDAQMNGALALFSLQRDISQGGYAIGSLNLLGCNVQLRAGVTLNAMAPVTINHASITGADANTDTLLVVYGSGDGAPEGDQIYTQTSTNVYAMASPASFNKDDQVIALPKTRPSPCNLILDTVSQAAIGISANVTVTTGVAGASNGAIYNLGKAPRIVAYAVRNGNLTLCDYMVNDCSSNAAANWTPMAGNIASMRAQYGRDDSATNAVMMGVVNKYDQTVEIPTAVSSVQCGWARVSAIRLALVARSGQYDKTNPTSPTSAAPTWDGSSGNPIDLTGTSANLPTGTTWKGYRYKVYQTVVPIRNVNWMGVQAGC